MVIITTTINYIYEFILNPDCSFLFLLSYHFFSPLYTFNPLLLCFCSERYRPLLSVNRAWHQVDVGLNWINTIILHHFVLFLPLSFHNLPCSLLALSNTYLFYHCCYMNICIHTYTYIYNSKHRLHIRNTTLDKSHDKTYENESLSHDLKL